MFLYATRFRRTVHIWTLATDHSSYLLSSALGNNSRSQVDINIESFGVISNHLQISS